MDWTTSGSMLVRGIVLGFAIAAPVGPIGVLCIRRTLTAGRIAGLASGLGAATADAIFSCVAAFGLTVIASALVSYTVWMRLIGGIFLCYLGLRMLRPALGTDPAFSPTAPLSVFRAYVTTLALTLTNPATILSFLAVFAGVGITNNGYGSALALVLGVFTGSALWWFLLSSAVGLVRHRMSPRGLLWINRLGGLIVLSFGGLALLSLWRG